MTSSRSVFDQPCAWRLEAARALDLPDDQLPAILSPGASFPEVLTSMVGALPATPTVLVDIGAGAGGASEWLRRATGARVVAVEPAPGARAVAARAFPELVVVEGAAADTGLPDDSADVVTLCGVCSLIADIESVIVEVGRIGARRCTVAITDLFAHERRIVSAPNVFRTIDETTELLLDHGWGLRNVGCGLPAVGTRWAPVADRVDTWIERHCIGRPGYDEWLADRRHLRSHIERGEVLAGSVVAQRVSQG